MLNDLDCAKLCQSLYDGERIFDYVGAIEEVSFAYKAYPDCNVVIFEGSHNIEDWKDNFDALLIRPPGLHGAGVHQGFYTGLPSVLTQLEKNFSKTKPLYITGHSLGAARAQIFAAMLTILGYNVIIVVFGSPRPGDISLAKILIPCSLRSYWNYLNALEHDIIYNLPLNIEPLFDYMQMRPPHKICTRPDPNDEWGPMIAWHRMKYYTKAIE